MPWHGSLSQMYVVAKKRCNCEARQFVKWGAIPNLQPSKILWKHETSCVTLITSLCIILLGWQGRSWGDRAAHYYYRHNILHPRCLFFLIITVHHFVQWTTLRSSFYSQIWIESDHIVAILSLELMYQSQDVCLSQRPYIIFHFFHTLLLLHYSPNSGLPTRILTSFTARIDPDTWHGCHSYI